MHNLRQTKGSKKAWLLSAFTVTCLAAQASNVVWDMPRPITGDADVITFGSLDRAYVMGYGPETVEVNGVVFVRFGENRALGNGVESLAQDQTTLVVAGDGDGILSTNIHNGSNLKGLSINYNLLLRSSVYDQGSPCALILDGLVVGKNYYFQSWMHDPLNPRNVQTISGGTNSIQSFAQSSSCILGAFVADNTNQAIVYTPRDGSAQMNAFQLRVEKEVSTNLTIIKQPGSQTKRVGMNLSMTVFIIGNPSPVYQWQRVTSGDTRNLTDDDKISGSRTSTLNFHALSSDEAGDYFVVAKNSFGSVTSSVATIMVATNQLINVAVSGADPMEYNGKAVLPGDPNDVWNTMDARNSFTNTPLVDSTGTATPVTLTLTKSDGSAVPHPLLGGISFAAKQEVTINRLLPNEFYSLVVFCVGGEANEGGVFSGAVSGISRGYPTAGDVQSEFSFGTNYVENPFACTDSKGTLTFSIKPNATAFPGGYPNCDFNGLQLLKVSPRDYNPVIFQQPLSVKNHGAASATLTVSAASPSTALIAYQWQKIEATGTSNLVSEGNISGANSNILTFNNLIAANDGDYQVVASNSHGAVTSRIATIIVLTNQLINMAVTVGQPTTYKGLAVLPGTCDDKWNGVDARVGFTNITLVDSTGAATPVTLTLEKNAGDATQHPLLGGISYASSQTVTIKNLLPDEVYDLVVFSAGGEINEGGVFSGAINGMTRGYQTRGGHSDFLSGINYVENVYASTDARGALAFTIRPTATAMPGGYANCDFNGLQIMKVSPPDTAPIITLQPASMKIYLRHPEVLSVTTVSPRTSPATYQWQKIAPNGTNDLADGDMISGSKTSALHFRALSLGEAGDYRVVAKNSFGSITSSVATVTADTNLLIINVSVRGADPVTYKGLAVLSGESDDIWNSVDARGSFENLPLVDSNGATTPVTLTLTKSDGDAIRHPMLGGISYATSQKVTIKNLLPDELYDLVVFSVGGQANEGGVFTGAVKGIAHGYSKSGVAPTDFLQDTNYVENPFARTDAHGTLTFTIKPNASAFAGGYNNCDFNGLQLMEGFRALHVPMRKQADN